MGTCMELAGSGQGTTLVGLGNLKAVHWNLDVPALYGRALRAQEGVLARGGPLAVLTGEHTGRSPKDRFIVEDETTRDSVWWGDVNVAMSREAFDRLWMKMQGYLQGREVFVQDLFAGAQAEHRLGVRVVCEQAWHSLFARNMFLRPSAEELKDFAPGLTVVQAPGLEADPDADGVRSSTFIALDLTRRVVLIGGTAYAGEIKKAVFTVLNFLLPERGVMPMHCAANMGDGGDVALFFGLSGTGKTTLSADPDRALIGDDEHGWSSSGIFNFEGGCYAKVIRLSPYAEPEIYATTQRFGTVLENVVVDPSTGALDLDDARYTENTRASYPLDFIPNALPTGQGGNPRHLVMLTADAFGVLPPLSRLTPAQAMYHFLSGYTARVAGTERGLGKEPSATFSACFGAPFMPRHPSVYARLLGDKIAENDCVCWLVNTGWTGGGYGVGRRMDIAHTRALLGAALSGGLEQVPYANDRHFGLAYPTQCPGVPAEVMDPRETWADKSAYDETAQVLTRRFAENFAPFADHVDERVKAAAIQAAA